MRKDAQKIVVGMSGGVDSSMALVLLKKQGLSPVGVSLRYAVWDDPCNALRENVCCSQESFQIARDICRKLNIPYHIVDVSADFRKNVINYFLSELRDSHTPNPCIICNRRLKFSHLLDWARRHGIDYVATGHYARVRKSETSGKYELLQAKDKQKDQTYSLSFLPQKWLAHVKFPLGEYTKEEIYQLAEREGFPVFLKQKQSQDFCFVAGKSMQKFLEKEIGTKKGTTKDTGGANRGTHRGLHFYTIGQRKGINISDGPYYVADKVTASNTLVITKDTKKLNRKNLKLYPFHFISVQAPKKPLVVRAKTRAHQPLASAKLCLSKENSLKLVFNNPQRAVTPGQFAVFYSKEVCLGGGCIINST